MAEPMRSESAIALADRPARDRIAALPASIVVR
jgi:hypothetical protein